MFPDNASGTSAYARVPLPGPSLEPRLVAEARGAADSLALRLRHHDAKLHATQVPMDLEARAVFDALETARVEALGARAVNMHFEDRFERGTLTFDYRLKPGVVQTSNALALMRAVGLEV